MIKQAVSTLLFKSFNCLITFLIDFPVQTLSSTINTLFKCIGIEFISEAVNNGLVNLFDKNTPTINPDLFKHTIQSKSITLSSSSKLCNKTPYSS